MQFRRIRYFLAVSEDLHFGRAAERLHITQPALSEQVQVLERELGVKLFERGTRRVELTAAGHVYMKRCKQLVLSAEEAAEEVRRIQRGEAGTLSIGFVRLSALDTLPQLVKTYLERHPGVRVVPRERNVRRQVQEIHEGQLDVGIAREPTAIRSLSSFVLSSDNHLLALPANHRLAKRKIVELSELAEERFVMYPRDVGSDMYDIIIAACTSAGFSPKVIQEADEILTVIGLVAAGVGIAIMHSAAQNIAHPNIVYRETRPRIAVRTGLIWDGSKKLSPTVKTFVNTCRSVAGLERVTSY